MELIQAIIVDDEPLDRELLLQLITTYCPYIRVVGEADGSEKALTLVHALDPDLIFLDIQMRGETGFDVLEKLSPDSRAKIVFTTGFDQYGIKAVKAGAFDYLLKPIDINELELLQQKLLQAMPGAPAESFMTLYNKGIQQVVFFDDIVFLQAQGSYTKLVLQSEEVIVASRNLKQLQEELPIHSFMKIHRSVVVNTRYISGFKNQGNEGEVVLRNGQCLPVSRAFKNKVQEFLR